MTSFLPDVRYGFRLLLKNLGTSLTAVLLLAVGLGANTAVFSLSNTLGLYSVLAFAVRTRVREFGIRMALGADRADLIAMVVRDALRIVLPGIVSGIFVGCG